MLNKIKLMLMAGLAGSLVGCATYVNIPPQPGDMAWHDPNHPTVQMVVSEALQAVAAHQQKEGRIAILLPDGTLAKNYSKTASQIRNETVWPGNPQRSEQPLLQVKAIRIRGTKAAVDVIHNANPQAPDTKDQLITVDLAWDVVEGWSAQRLKLWRTDAQNVTTPGSLRTIAAYP